MNRRERRALKSVGFDTMDNQNKTLDDIRQKYMHLCAQAGELQYKIGEFTAALEDLNGQIAAVNRDYSAALQASKAPAAAPKQEEAPSAEAAAPEAPSAA